MEVLFYSGLGNKDFFVGKGEGKGKGEVGSESRNMIVEDVV